MSDLSAYMERIERALADLPEVEREIVTRAAESVAAGAKLGLRVYGPALPTVERRDLDREIENELRDALFYRFLKQLVAEERARMPSTLPCTPPDCGDLVPLEEIEATP